MPGSQEATYASYFRSSEFADAEITFTTTGDEEVRVLLDHQGLDHVNLQVQVQLQAATLTKFPCHRIMLDKCPFFAAQVKQ